MRLGAADCSARADLPITPRWSEVLKLVCDMRFNSGGVGGQIGILYTSTDVGDRATDW